MSNRTKLTSHLVLLIALCGILYLLYLGNVSFFLIRANQELAVQDIVQRGEWLFPLFKRATAIPSTTAAVSLVGGGDFAKTTGKYNNHYPVSVRSLCHARCSLCLFLGRKLYGGTIGLLPGRYSPRPWFTAIKRERAVDMTLCFFETLSFTFIFYALYRGFLTHSCDISRCMRWLASARWQKARWEYFCRDW